jgi:hypothetical protein
LRLGLICRGHLWVDDFGHEESPPLHHCWTEAARLRHRIGARSIVDLYSFDQRCHLPQLIGWIDRWRS